MLWRSVKGARDSIRRAVALFAVLTALATVGSGEHYLVDLIAAVPFLVALEAATAHRIIPLRRRIAPLTAGIGFYLLWVAIARNGPSAIPYLYENTLVARFLAIATLLVPSAVALKHSDIANRLAAAD
jgi:hypothetical protein